MNNDFDLEIADAANAWGIPFSWVKAIMIAESGGNPRAYRAEPQIDDASRGLMQFLLSTARGLGYTGEPDGLYDPAISLDLGAHYIHDLRRSYGEDFQAVYSAYNSGSPTKYKTSSQVAANVARAVANLAAVEGGITQVEGVADPEISGWLLLLVLAISAVWYFSGRGK